MDIDEKTEKKLDKCIAEATEDMGIMHPASTSFPHAKELVKGAEYRGILDDLYQTNGAETDEEKVTILQGKLGVDSHGPENLHLPCLESLFVENAKQLEQYGKPFVLKETHKKAFDLIYELHAADNIKRKIAQNEKAPIWHGNQAGSLAQ